MKTLTTQKSWKYILWLGPMLIIMGVVAGLVSGTWLPIPLGLLITGILLIGIWIALMSTSPQSFWGRRSTQTGTNAFIATLAVFGILALINFLGVRHAVRLDLTENQLFTLSPESQQVVHNLQQPVKVWIFDRGQNPLTREMLDNYRRSGSRFSFEFVDPQFQPGLAESFGVQKFGEVYLESGTKRQLLQTLNQGEPLSEIKLTNGIQQLNSDRNDKVFFLQGHGEHPLDAVEGGLSQALNALKSKNFNSEPLNLPNLLEVPKEAAAVVIAGPKRALFAAEVKALSSYLAAGGSVFVMVDPKVNSGLEGLLKDWGVQLDNGIAVDASERVVGFGPVTPLINRYGNHPITKSFRNGNSFYPLARSVDITPVDGIKETPLLLTDESSWAESNPNEQPLKFDPGSDRQGPLTLGVALEGKVNPQSALNSPATQSKPLSRPGASPKPTPTPSAPQPENTNQGTAEARLVVIGNSNFATDGLFEQQLNGDVFLNSVSWLSKRDEQSLSIRPKETQNRRINITPQQAQLLSWTALLIMPGIGFSLAAFLWWRRR